MTTPHEGRPIEVLVVALRETAGSALYGMVDVLSAAGTIWPTLTRGSDARRLFNVRIVSPQAQAFTCGHGIPVQPHCAVTDDPQAALVIVPELWLGPDESMQGRHPEVVDWLRQRSRPYLFSNTLMPAIAAASLKVFEIIENGDELRRKLYGNAARFRSSMSKLGFTLAGADHPIIPVMLGDAALAQAMAEKMLARGIYVIGFSFPVVPKGQARIRTQMSAAHSTDDIDRAVAAFGEVGRQLGVIS